MSPNDNTSLSLRCILTGQWKIYIWTDTGYGNLMYVTPVTHYHALWLWMPYLLEQCGVTVWEASCSSCSSWEWQEGRTDCDSSHCGSAPGLFLPPVSRCSFTLSQCTWCHLSTYFAVPWGGRAKRSSWLRQESLYHFISHCRASCAYQQSYITRGRWCWHKREADGTSLSFIPPLNRGGRSVEFRWVPDSQAFGAGSGIRRQIPFFHAYVSSVIAFCLITFFHFLKGAHLKWRWLVFYKQLCVPDCRRIARPFSQGKPGNGLHLYHKAFGGM